MSCKIEILSDVSLIFDYGVDGYKSIKYVYSGDVSDYFKSKGYLVGKRYCNVDNYYVVRRPYLNSYDYVFSIIGGYSFISLGVRAGSLPFPSVLEVYDRIKNLNFSQFNGFFRIYGGFCDLNSKYLYLIKDLLNG